MANEISLQSGITVRKGFLDQLTRPSSFRDTMLEVGGPTPGTLIVTTTGMDVDLSQLVEPGWIWVQNLDPDNYVELGLHDGSLFHPFAEIPPGLCAGPFKLSRNFGEEHTLPGTGTSGVLNTLYLRANTDTCNVFVFCLER
jgi:hypothetical protein